MKSAKETTAGKKKAHAHIHRAVEQQLRKDWVHTAYTSYKIQD